jgi:hypothetical protein
MARSSSLLAREENVLQRLLRSRPEARTRLQPYVRRAKAYHNECGCSMSGAFLVTAVLLAFIHRVYSGNPGQTGFITEVAIYAAFVLSAGFVGKLAGISIARIRLVLLYRDLRNLFPLDGG